jgi:CPA2 family monovalent cation:H+ antiporter-2
MLTTESVMFEVGAVMLIAFIGAALASKAKQSVILGYILAGILIGPNMHLAIGSFSYDGVIQDTSFTEYLSHLGLILLMFFVGLEFSVSKLKKTKTPVALLAMMNLGINMFTGILLGTALGWSLIDTVFLAGVIAMSSAAVTAKSLIELKRLANPETEFLLGIAIVESFLSMILLTVIGGMMVRGASSSVSLTKLAVGIVVFYAFFVFLAVFVIPRTVSHLRKIRSDEMFVLFALGLVFLSAALAEACGVPAIIGAFFIGMVFAETKVSERFGEKIVPFRDAFVAIFFVSFGMLIDPAMFTQVWWIVAIAVPLVILNDLIITTILAYFLGFSAKASTSMSSALCGRGAESVMYATVGSRSVGVTKGAELYPFAGAFCFIMSAIAPFLMKKSNVVAERGSRALPRSIKFSGAVISRTLGKLIMPSSFHLYKPTRKIGIALIVYFIALTSVIVTSGLAHLIAFAIAVAVTAATWRILGFELHSIVRNTNYSNLGAEVKRHNETERFVSMFVFINLLTIVLASFLFSYYWQIVLIVLLVYFVGVLMLMRKNYRDNYGSFPIAAGYFSDGASGPERAFEAPVVSDRVVKKNRWRWL